MKYFLDSAKIEEIKYAHDNWGIDGVTTNPKHIKIADAKKIAAMSDNFVIKIPCTCS